MYFDYCLHNISLITEMSRAQCLSATSSLAMLLLWKTEADAWCLTPGHWRCWWSAWGEGPALAGSKCRQTCVVLPRFSLSACLSLWTAGGKKRKLGLLSSGEQRLSGPRPWFNQWKAGSGGKKNRRRRKTTAAAEERRREEQPQPLEMCGWAEIAAVGNVTARLPLRRVVFHLIFLATVRGGNEKEGGDRDRAASRCYLGFFPP